MPSLLDRFRHRRSSSASAQPTPSPTSPQRGKTAATTTTPASPSSPSKSRLPTAPTSPTTTAAATRTQAKQPSSAQDGVVVIDGPRSSSDRLRPAEPSSPTRRQHTPVADGAALAFPLPPGAEAAQPVNDGTATPPDLTRGTLDARDIPARNSSIPSSLRGSLDLSRGAGGAAEPASSAASTSNYATAASTPFASASGLSTPQPALSGSSTPTPSATGGHHKRRASIPHSPKVVSELDAIANGGAERNTTAMAADSAGPSTPSPSRKLAGSQNTASSPSRHYGSVYGVDADASDHLRAHMANLHIAPPRSVIDTEGAKPLNEQREEMVQGITESIQARKGDQGGLTAQGEDIFRQAGMEDAIGVKDTIDVQARYLKPVVQERIIRKEHTDYMTVINREVHKYHIYPKIQPVHDPDPIQLPTRHRIFSQADGKWHEVVGDAAAIAILGEDVFHNGPREVREERKIVMPGDPRFESAATNGGTSTAIRPKAAGDDGYAIKGRIMEREYVKGGPETDWREVSQVGTAL